MDAGALEEVRQLAALGLDPALPIMSALGVRPLLRTWRELSPEEAVAAAQTETRQYAKRQLTWARGNMIRGNGFLRKKWKVTSANFVSFIDR